MQEKLQKNIKKNGFSFFFFLVREKAKPNVKASLFVMSVTKTSQNAGFAEDPSLHSG